MNAKNRSRPGVEGVEEIRGEYEAAEGFEIIAHVSDAIGFQQREVWTRLQYQGTYINRVGSLVITHLCDAGRDGPD